MVLHARRPVRPPTLLIASASPGFDVTVRRLLATTDVRLAEAFEWEAAWLSLTRTQPNVVLADCGAPSAHVRSVVSEALARALPLLLAHRPSEGGAVPGSLAPYEHGGRAVARVELPLSMHALRAALHSLVGWPAVGRPSGAGRLTLVPRDAIVDLQEDAS
ncbi:MAG TPA: hypothetical protein VEA99_11550 [Gemmatimonadaceae bacterium]|nr:hypothetical protein [Gemmatimonadaceae bacterium]